jgi:hypothetical protein
MELPEHIIIKGLCSIAYIARSFKVVLPFVYGITISGGFPLLSASGTIMPFVRLLLRISKILQLQHCFHSRSSHCFSTSPSQNGYSLKLDFR